MKKILVYSLLFISCFSLCGCGNEIAENNDNLGNTGNIEEQMNSVIDEGNYIILDVRTKEEYDEGHVVGAINIPYDEINSESDLDITKTIMVYCRSGKRSSIAYNTLKDLGYDVLDLGAYDSINLEKDK